MKRRPVPPDAPRGSVAERSATQPPQDIDPLRIARGSSDHLDGAVTCAACEPAQTCDLPVEARGAFADLVPGDPEAQSALLRHNANMGRDAACDGTCGLVGCRQPYFDAAGLTRYGDGLLSPGQMLSRGAAPLDLAIEDDYPASAWQVDEPGSGPPVPGPSGAAPSTAGDWRCLRCGSRQAWPPATTLLGGYGRGRCLPCSGWTVWESAPLKDVGRADCPPRFPRLRVLDLFSGLAGWGDPFRDAGHEVFGIDIDRRFEADAHLDVGDVAAVLEAVPWRPDVIFASPPCNSFSTASMGKMWEHGATPRPKRSQRHPDGHPIAIEGMRLVLDRAKPTDLWGVFPPGLVLPPECKNGNPDHVAAPRGSRTGTQGGVSREEAGRIPRPLAEAFRAALERAEGRRI